MLSQYQALIGITPEVETISTLGRGTFKLSDKFNLIGEYIFSRNEVTTSIAPDVYSRSVTLPSTSQYYPGKGIVPAVNGLSNGDLQLYLRHKGETVQAKQPMTHIVHLQELRVKPMVGISMQA